MIMGCFSSAYEVLTPGSEQKLHEYLRSCNWPYHRSSWSGFTKVSTRGNWRERSVEKGIQRPAQTPALLTESPGFLAQGQEAEEIALVLALGLATPFKQAPGFGHGQDGAVGHVLQATTSAWR
ncbi:MULTISPECIES: hypothetical protein [unclassified Pseudomonas]|uniref:hypothetical protein n=1 Tax=unclassified Pseudomonas TaxID=196821 RepID=UPI00131A8D6C|nr:MULTISPECIES: hypothetical protein [unclassified Pseudomonas]